MSARVTVTSQAVASPPSGVFVDSGQAFIVGQTEKGPVVPTRVFGLADFRALYGERTGGVDMTDVVTAAFKEGLAGAVILRAVGPAAAKATIGLDSNKIVVTAKDFGAYANGWTAQYTSSSKTITLVKGATTVTYTGTDAASLQTAASVDPDVTVTVSSLPSGNVTATALASGTDDYANANVATTLAKLDADLGDGAVVWPGKRAGAIAAAMQTHCEATGRLGLLSLDAATTQAQAISAAAAITAGDNVALLWPHTTVPLATGTRTIEPTGLALGARARAHGEGPQASPIRDIYGRALWVTGVEEQTTATEWAALNSAGVSVVRSANGQLRLYGWRTVTADVSTLTGAQFRDVINRVQAGCSAIAEAFVGRTVDGKGQTLAEFNGALTGFLAEMGAAFFAGANDPGFVVNTGSDVNTTASLADGELNAEVGVRLAPTAEFITIQITATDAAGAL